MTGETRTPLDLQRAQARLAALKQRIAEASRVLANLETPELRRRQRAYRRQLAAEYEALRRQVVQQAQANAEARARQRR